MVQSRHPSDHHPGATKAARQIYDLLRARMADGTLVPGTRAPFTRALAAELAVSRTTVTAAYEQLVAERFLVTSTGRAARVASPLAAPAPSATHASRQFERAPSLSGFGRRLTGIGMPALPGAEPVDIDFQYGAVASRDFPTLLWRRAYQTGLARRCRLQNQSTG